jgi:hypothetical protein
LNLLKLLNPYSSTNKLKSKMKKFLSLAVVMLGIVSAAFSQFTVTMPLVAGDTVVNTASVHKQLPRLTGGYSGVVITVKVTEIGSVTSGGSVGIYASADGTTWDLLGSAYTVTDVATQQKTFQIAAPVPEYLRVTQTGTGTMQSVPTVSYRITSYQQTR